MRISVSKWRLWYANKLIFGNSLLLLSHYIASFSTPLFRFIIAALTYLVGV